MISNGSQQFTVSLPDGRPLTMYRAHAKGALYHESPITNLLAIGSRGSGKSLIMRYDAHMRLMSCPGANAILVRNTYKELVASHVYFQPLHHDNIQWSTLKEEMQLLGGDYNATDFICHYPNGSRLFLTYVGNERDSLRLTSSEYIAGYFDELSLIPWEYFLKMTGSIRVSGYFRDIGVKPVVRAATNPLGASTAEVMKYFVNKDVDPEEDPEYNPLDWDHIRINMEDNPHLDVESYRKRFSVFPAHIRKAWLDGEYEAEGALFSFRPNRDGRPWHVVTDLDIDKLVRNARIYRAFDMGYKPDPAYCIWIAHLGNRYIAFHEQQWKETIVSDIAADIQATDKMLGITRVHSTFCDPVMDVHTGHDVRTIKDLFENNGIPMDCSINNREQYASAVHTALAEEVTVARELPVVPRLQIYRGPRGTGCPYLIKALPLQQYNPKRPLAMADNKHDHPVVALAYFLISHSADERVARQQKEMKPWMRPKRIETRTLGDSGVRTRRRS